MDFIHKFLPSRTGRNDMTLLLLHGTGGNEEDLLSIGEFLSPDAALLSVRGKVLEGTLPRFFRRVSEGVFDEEDLIFRTHELARFVEEAVKVYSLDVGNIVGVGYSNGANIAASMLLLEPEILTAAVLYRAMVPIELEQLPKLDNKRVLIQSGIHDPIVRGDNSRQLAKMFEEAGAIVTFNWQDAGHGLMRSELAIAHRWIQQGLMTKRPFIPGHTNAI